MYGKDEREEAKKLYGTFQDAYEKWKADPENLKPIIEYCECGLELPPGFKQTWNEGQVYCDGQAQHIQVTDAKRHNATSTWINHGPAIYFKGWCPVYSTKLAQAEAKKVESAYVTLTGAPMTLEAFDEATQPHAYNIASTLPVSGKLILGGIAGCGKTHLARGLWLRFIREGRNAKWISAVDLAELFRRNQSFNDDKMDRMTAENKLKSLSQSQSLFIDDLGSERHTDSEIFQEQFQNVLDLMRGGLVITTNYPGKELTQRYGEKICSRIFANTTAVTMASVNYREKFYPSNLSLPTAGRSEEIKKADNPQPTSKPASLKL